MPGSRAVRVAAAGVLGLMALALPGVAAAASELGRTQQVAIAVSVPGTAVVRILPVDPGEAGAALAVEVAANSPWELRLAVPDWPDPSVELVPDGYTAGLAPWGDSARLSAAHPAVELYGPAGVHRLRWVVRVAASGRQIAASVPPVELRVAAL